jgi:predicted HicB family RNase H-like nuclease
VSGPVARPRVYDEERVTTAVRLSPSLRARLHETARAEGVSVNQLVVRILADYLGRRGRRAAPGLTAR